MNTHPDRSSWFERDAVRCVLRLHVQPGARRSETVGLHGGRLKLRIAAPAIEGRANEALVAFLAAQLGVPRARIRVMQGLQGRLKRVEIDAPGVDPERLLPR